MPLLLIFGCVTRPQLALYPITKTDICFKGDKDCSIGTMDIGMSEFYFHKILDLENAK